MVVFVGSVGVCGRKGAKGRGERLFCVFICQRFSGVFWVVRVVTLLRCRVLRKMGCRDVQLLYFVIVLPAQTQSPTQLAK